ncbi:uncharacterized protein [Diadema setosum]|uniref:uncharacterized protein n=1 Tax=Diadema setosum TaxID=31175 RepID=UPI003B3BC21A
MEDCSYAVLLISKNFMEDKKCLRHYHIALDYSDMNDDFAECVLPILFGDLNLTADLGSITHVRWGSRYFEGVMARSISSNKRVEKERQSSSSGPPPFSQTPRTLSLNVQSGMSWSQAPIQSSIQVTDQSRRVSQTALRKPEQEACLMPSEVDSPSLPPIPAPTVASGGAVCATGGAQTTTTCHRESMQGQASWASDSPPSVQCDQGSLASGPSQAPCPQSAADIFLELDVSSQPSERSAAILSHGRFAELCNLLDPTHPTGSDWTMLAEILDLKKSQIGVLNEKRGGQTKMLLEIFFRLHEGEERLAILEKLQDTLEIMDRNDAEDVIKKEIKILKCRNLKCKKR